MIPMISLFIEPRTLCRRNRRLPIIDVVSGHQPSYSADRRIVDVQNDEDFTLSIGEWFRLDPNAICRELLVTSPTLISEMLDVSAVAAMAHRTAKANYAREIRAFRALGIWTRALKIGNFAA